MTKDIQQAKYLKVTMLAIIATVLGSFSCASQEYKKWEVNDAFENKVFVESKGQYDKLPVKKEDALFIIENTGEQIFFGKKGITFLYSVPVKTKNEKSLRNEETLSEQEREREKEHQKSEYRSVSMKWLGANNDVEIVAENPNTDWYSYYSPSSPEGVVRCKTYNKITYKNIYPGIDVEYTFHKEKGLKYNIMLHANADASSIKMQYTGAKDIYIDKKGILHITSPKGEIIDHAPKTFYASESSEIASSFILNSNTVFFNLGNYDKGKDIVIDPWVISPGFTTVDRAYDIIRNPATGEIFVYGGAPQFQIKKYTAAGVLIYSYVTSIITNTNATDKYGDIAIDPA